MQNKDFFKKTKLVGGYIIYYPTWHTFVIILFIYLFLPVLGLRCYAGFSLVVVSWDYSSLQPVAFHCSGFSCCGTGTLGTRASVVAAHRRRVTFPGLCAPWLSSYGTQASRQVGSSWTGDWTPISCPSRRTVGLSSLALHHPHSITD